MRCRYLIYYVRICLNITKAYYVNCREKSWDLYKGDWEDYRQELKRLFDEIVQEAGESESVYQQATKAEGRNHVDNVLSRFADVTKSIDVSLVTSSRD